MLTIGITGTPGAGKGTVVEYLKQKYGFKHYSARAWISEELTRRGLELTRENMRIIANEIRSLNGPGYIIEKLYEQAQANGGNAVIESLRNPQEIAGLRKKSKNFLMLAVDADSHVRYDRIVKRKSSTDSVSFNKFLEDEQAEMNDTDPAGMRIAECISMADVVLNNDGSVEDLNNQVDQAVQNLV